MSKLNMKTFNEILINAGIDKKELLQNEIEAGYGHKIVQMENLVDALNKKRPKKIIDDLLRTINNIDRNLDDLNNELMEMEKDEE